MGTAISKFEVATRQMSTAIDLYLRKDDLVSVVTLAGAADEILGVLVRQAGDPSALDEAIERLCGMYEAAFSEPANPKAFVELRNSVRNQFKHLSGGADFTGDLEREARSMIRRAIDNYRKLAPGFVEEFRQF